MLNHGVTFNFGPAKLCLPAIFDTYFYCIKTYLHNPNRCFVTYRSVKDTDNVSHHFSLNLHNLTPAGTC